MGNYLIIGGSSGIGLEIVKQLQPKAETIIVLSRSGDALQGMSKVQHHPVDITKDEIPEDVIPESIDGFVYCPGTINLKPFRSLKLSDFQHDLEVNVLGAIKALKAAQRALKKAEAPGVVLFSTVAAEQGMPFHASIATAKAAVEGLTRSLAAEWSPKIRVNCIAPSLTDTPLAEKLLSSEDKRKSGADRHPLRRLGTAQDIANTALFLLSPESSWISGQVIGVDGGLSRLRV
jgi:NAD(P)-dependent dehydrogenase (short-subunit alcohol dehydrogenase family)